MLVSALEVLLLSCMSAKSAKQAVLVLLLNARNTTPLSLQQNHSHACSAHIECRA